MSGISRELQQYNEKNLRDFGPGAKGVGWKDKAAQVKRFEQLVKIIAGKEAFSLNDLGCGLGDFFTYLKAQNYADFHYNGYDVSAEMLQLAQGEHEASPRINFYQIQKPDELRPADYAVASGIFNLKFEVPEHTWLNYILENLYWMNKTSRKGFAFNVLTKYSDKEFMRPDLYYADPLFFFDFCKRNFSKNIALLHDYEEYDFTILVRK
jgi:SAM-dependent methyltransferase